ncbi:MAG: hypothetical protein WD017_05425 [Cucumibacter sp.]
MKNVGREDKIATSNASSASAGPPTQRRQAIVIVHGQGKPRPMGTLRDFVKVLWTQDRSLKLADTAMMDPAGNPSWIVPDDKTGLLDLQRISCPPLASGRITDFFELYFADIVGASPLQNFWRWLNRLLWIDPHEVSRPMRLGWVALWVLSLLALAAFWIMVLSVERLVHLDWIGVLLGEDNRGALGAFAAGIGLFLVASILARATRFQRLVTWPAMIVAAAAIAYIYREYPVFWAAAVFFFLASLGQRYLLPYFGAAASYLGAEAGTVGIRNRVRERGLSLLRALHDDPRYDRIVLVAHSLGAVLAYDLLHLLWWQVGPTAGNPPGEEAIAAFNAVDDFIAAHPEKVWPPETVGSFQRLQGVVCEALSRQPSRPQHDDPGRHSPPGWKLSDFVSLGSPLANAQFLIAEGKADFAQLKHAWMLPCSPPNKSTRFNRMVNTIRGIEAAHHGAVFGAVRWTNLYDPFHPVAFLIGDPVGGPVAGLERFGRGIADRAVRMRHAGWVPRFFTHNYYWTDTNRNPEAPAEQVRLLREAVGIGR